MTAMNAEIGTRYRLAGVLRLSGRGLVMEIDDRGVGALAAEPEHRPLAGGRVRLEGKRSGFDRIDVQRIGPT